MSLLTVKDYTFEVTEPYASGATVILSEGEAHALNQTRKENIGNIIRPVILKADKTADEINAYFADLDASYAFGATRARGPRLVGLAAYIRDVGESMFKTWYATKGAAQAKAKGVTLPRASAKDPNEREAYKALMDRFTKAKAADIEAEAKVRFESDAEAVANGDDDDLI